MAVKSKADQNNKKSRFWTLFPRGQRKVGILMGSANLGQQYTRGCRILIRQRKQTLTPTSLLSREFPRELIWSQVTFHRISLLLSEASTGWEGAISYQGAFSWLAIIGSSSCHHNFGSRELMRKVKQI